MVVNSPKITIITPSYNQAIFLEQTIISVLSQNYPNLEYIIIDGGSTDGSIEVIKKYAHELAFWCSEPDDGHYDAINKGFHQASGDIFAWLNSDDMYYPWTLRTVANIMATLPQVSWLTTLRPGYWDWHGFCFEVDGVWGYSKDAFLDGRYIPGGEAALGWIQQESTFWRRSLWEQTGASLNSRYHLAADFELWSRFYAFTDLYATPSLLGGFRFQDHQRSLQKSQYRVEAETALEKMRQQSSWKADVAKERWRQYRKNTIIRHLPKIRNYVASLARSCYLGKRVVRKQVGSPLGFWDVETYSFWYEE